ncbi:GTPase Era [Xanthobacter tagetidis]|uniref:GTPase Era n=1 Tax=Xanthobacter tagetidis TaxID=60216 RepID=A0A3L6ZUA9_9HYPH|nr:GTP-binding protein Era [Xanthobacter tagetidis]RLP71573.1 GTPase Era [Xanthobacter tagetidis]
MSGKTGDRGKPSGKTIDDTTDEAAAQAAGAQQRRAASEGEASETAAKEAAFDPEADLAGTAFDPAAPDDLDDDDLDDEDLDDDELDAHARDQRDDQARDSAEFAQDRHGPSRSPALPEGPTRCGFVALIGAPNAGKSTLTNALVGTKVSIVSHKVQTTRAIVRGIALAGSAQLILVDTPGIFSPKRRLERAMVSSAWTQAADADVVALLVDAKRGLDAEVEGLLQPLANIRRPRALILNKIDLIRRDTLLELASRLTEQVAFERVFMISALTGDGIEDVKAWFAQAVPFGPWLYPEDQISDAPMRMLAAEITREKMFVRLHDELPYRSTVETESWKELRDGSVRIEQTIFVERESQRKIVLGKGGATIKAISSESRAEISEIIEQKVHLFLFVKVRENWADDPERYREMGLEFPKG